LFYILSLISGVLISISIALNGRLAGEHGLHFSSVIVHITGLVVIAIVLLIKREMPFAKGRPFLYHFGGAFGVIIVLFNNLAFGRISVSAILALILLGQSAAGLAFDQFGLMGMKKYPFNKRKIVGLILIICGIIVMIDQFDFVAMLLSVLAGASTVISRTLNAKLSNLSSVRTSTFYNYLVGLAFALVVFLLFGGGEAIHVDRTLSTDLYIYLGGILGVCFILINTLLVPKISAFYLTLLLFVGQVFAGIAIDAIIDQAFSLPIIIGGVLVGAGLCADLLLERWKQGNH